LIKEVVPARGCDENKERFEAHLGKIVKAKAPQDPKSKETSEKA
jgi:hypothetical protein